MKNFDEIAGNTPFWDETTGRLIDSVVNKTVDTLTKEPTGVPIRTDNTFTFVDNTRIFTLQPTGESFDVWLHGNKITISTSITVQIPDVTSKYYICVIANGTLTYVNTFDLAILNDKVFIATVYWNSTTQKGEFINEERHGLTMDWATHFHLHNSFGTRYYGGFDITFTSLVGDGSNNNHAQIGLNGGIIADEDLVITVVDDSTPTNFFEQELTGIAKIPVIYKLGVNGDWRKNTATSYPVKLNSNKLQYNNFTTEYVLTDCTDGYYTAVWIFASPDINSPVMSILGNREDSTLIDAQNNNLYSDIDFTSLPSEEYKLLYRLIYQSDSNYTNDINATLRDILDLRGEIDSILSNQIINPTNNHSALLNLNEDSHPQYHNDSRGDSRYNLKNTQVIHLNDSTPSIIKTTIDAISDASATKPYIVYLNSGKYVGDTITMKPYVALISESYVSTFIEVNATNKDVIIGADQSYISGVTLSGATDSGKCGIKYSSGTGNSLAFFYVENVRFGANNILVKSIGTGGQSCSIQCSNIKYCISSYDTGFVATYDGISGSSTIQIRSSTTTASLGVSIAQSKFALVDGANCQIVCNGIQVNKSGATSGTAFEAINGGSLRLTSVNIRNWGIGINMPNTGSSTNISGIGLNFENNTEDLNVAHTTATGKVENANYSKSTIADGSGVYIQGSDVNTIRIRKKGGDYDNFIDAIASITNNSATNIYILDIGAGIWDTPLVDLSSYPYVNVRGSSINSTVIRALNTNHNIFKLGEMNEISFLTIEDTGSGFAGVYVSNGGDFQQLHKVTFNNCDIGILIENSTVDSQFYGEYVDFAGTFSYSVKVSNTSTGISFVNLENCYSFPSAGINTCYLCDGSNIDFHLELSGNANDSGSIGGKGIEWYNGAKVTVQSSYFNNFTTAISMPNTGSAPRGNFTSVTTNNCTTDLSIQHATGTGSFQGVMNNPVISIVSTAVFGVSYLESLLGNKKEIYFDASGFNLIAGTTPTTSASTRASLTAVGFTFLVFGGANNSDAGASVNFRVPKDYLRNGRFKLVWTSTTGVNNIKWQFTVTKKATGENLATVTETGLSVVVTATTQYNIQETSWITSTTTYAIGDTVSIRVYRLGNDASDTHTGDAYVSGLVFEYEASK